MLIRNFKILLITTILAVSFNLYCSELAQMEVGGVFYALSYQRAQEGNHAFKPEISEGKLVFFDESDENGGITLQLFDKRKSEITGNADGISIFMKNREGRKIFSKFLGSCQNNLTK